MYCRVCNAGCLNSSLVIGKIVVCDDPDADFEASIAGAVGSILKNDPFDDIADVFSLPTCSLSVDKYDIVASYLNSTKYRFLDILVCSLHLLSLNDSIVHVFYFTESLKQPF